MSDSRSRSRSPIDSDDDSSRTRRHDKRKYDKPSSGKKVPSDCRVYVSNIPYEFKWQDLKDLFRSEVGNVAYVEMFNDDNGRPRGSAIVDFENADMAQKAIEKMHRMELKGRKLVVKEKDEIIHSRDFMFLFNKDLDRERNNRFTKDLDRRLNFNRGGGSSFSDNVHPPVNYGNTYGLSVSFLESLGINGPLVSKVFVANLDYKVTEDDLREVFKVAGKVMDAEVVKDNDGKSRGFGTVEYEHPIQAVQAISMLHNQNYYDRKLSVRLDRVGDKQKDGSSKLPPGLKSLGMGLGANGEPIIDVTALPTAASASSNTQAMSAVNPVMGMGGGYNMSPNTNMASNMASNMSSNMPTSLPNNMTNNMGNNMRTGVNPVMPMMGLGGMDSLGMGGGSTMGMGGMGGSALPTTPNMMNMGAMNQGNMANVPSPNNFPNQNMGMNTGTGNAPMFSNGNSNFTNTQTPSDFNSGYSSTSSPASRTVLQISNLPLDYTWKNLKDLCRNYGDIRFAEIKSKGVGWVRFATETETRRTADLLDRQRFDGRVLDACVL